MNKTNSTLAYKNVLILAVSLALCVFNNYMGHYYPPFSISKTPLLIGLVTAGIMYLTDFKLFTKFCWISFFILLNDLLIRIYAGGNHDSEGVGWITLFLLMGLGLAFIIVLIYRITRERTSLKNYLIKMLICLVYLLIFHMILMK